MLNIIAVILVIGLIFWLKFFAEDWITSSKWHEYERKKGEGYWKWVTSKPYFTPKKILYWAFLTILLSVYMYLGFNLPI